MTLEFVEKNTNIRFARTYFLNVLAQKYMSNYDFSQDDDDPKTNQFGKQNELHTRQLLNAYIALILTFNQVAEEFMKSPSEDIQNHQSCAWGMFQKIYLNRCNEDDIMKLIMNGKDGFDMQIKAYDTMGYEVGFQNNLEKKLIVIRI